MCPNSGENRQGFLLIRSRRSSGYRQLENRSLQILLPKEFDDKPCAFWVFFSFGDEVIETEVFGIEEVKFDVSLNTVELVVENGVAISEPSVPDTIFLPELFNDSIRDGGHVWDCRLKFQ